MDKLTLLIGLVLWGSLSAYVPFAFDKQAKVNIHQSHLEQFKQAAKL